MPIAHNFEAKWRSDDVKISEEAEFSSLLLSDQLMAGLAKAGFKNPSPIQLEAIPIGICGRDMVVQAKSGTGKTLVFTIVALETLMEVAYPQVLIMAPTREIASQISNVITTVGSQIPKLKCSTFIGGMPIVSDVENIIGCQIVVGTPGRLKQLIDRRIFRPEHIRLFILDEVDELLNSSFESDLEFIFNQLPEEKQVITTSATYPQVLKKLVKMFLRNPYFVRLNIDELSLLGMTHYIHIMPSMKLPMLIYRQKLEILEKVLTTVKFSQCVVFCNSIYKVENLWRDIRKWGFSSTYISSNKTQEDRLKAVEILKRFKVKVLVSSNLISRGIDAENVDLIINFDLPQHSECFLHRVGRAGRYGSKGVSVTLLLCDQMPSFHELQKEGNFKCYLLPIPVPENLINIMPNEEKKVVVPESLPVEDNETEESSSTEADQIDAEPEPVSQISVGDSGENARSELMQYYKNIVEKFEVENCGDAELVDYAERIRCLDTKDLKVGVTNQSASIKSNLRNDARVEKEVFDLKSKDIKSSNLSRDEEGNKNEEFSQISQRIVQFQKEPHPKEDSVLVKTKLTSGANDVSETKSSMPSSSKVKRVEKSNEQKQKANDNSETKSSNSSNSKEKRDKKSNEERQKANDDSKTSSSKVKRAKKSNEEDQKTNDDFKTSSSKVKRAKKSNEEKQKANDDSETKSSTPSSSKVKRVKKNDEQKAEINMSLGSSSEVELKNVQVEPENGAAVLPSEPVVLFQKEEPASDESIGIDKAWGLLEKQFSEMMKEKKIKPKEAVEQASSESDSTDESSSSDHVEELSDQSLDSQKWLYVNKEWADRCKNSAEILEKGKVAHKKAPKCSTEKKEALGNSKLVRCGKNYHSLFKLGSPEAVKLRHFSADSDDPSSDFKRSGTPSKRFARFRVGSELTDDDTTHLQDEAVFYSNFNKLCVAASRMNTHRSEHTSVPDSFHSGQPDTSSVLIVEESSESDSDSTESDNDSTESDNVSTDGDCDSAKSDKDSTESDSDSTGSDSDSSASSSEVSEECDMDESIRSSKARCPYKSESKKQHCYSHNPSGYVNYAHCPAQQIQPYSYTASYQYQNNPSFYYSSNGNGHCHHPTQPTRSCCQPSHRGRYRNSGSSSCQSQFHYNGPSAYYGQCRSHCVPRFH